MRFPSAVCIQTQISFIKFSTKEEKFRRRSVGENSVYTVSKINSIKDFQEISFIKLSVETGAVNEEKRKNCIFMIFYVCMISSFLCCFMIFVFCAFEGYCKWLELNFGSLLSAYLYLLLVDLMFIVFVWSLNSYYLFQMAWNGVFECAREKTHVFGFCLSFIKEFYFFRALIYHSYVNSSSKLPLF